MVGPVALLWLFAAMLAFGQSARTFAISQHALDSLRDGSAAYLYIDSVTFLPLWSSTGKRRLAVDWHDTWFVVQRGHPGHAGQRGAVGAVEIVLAGTVREPGTGTAVPNAFVGICRRYALTGRLLDSADVPSTDTASNVPYVGFIPQGSTRTDSAGRFRLRLAVAQQSWLVVSHDQHDALLIDVGAAVKASRVRLPRHR
jgi:hypothetical protein